MRATSSAERILSNKKRLIFNIALVLTLLLIALSAYLIIEAAKEEGAAVIVSVDGKNVAEYSLKKNGEYSINGGTNILVIENGMAYMRSADCPRQFCVNSGKIHRTNEHIVCAHNKVMVLVVGAGDEIFRN